MVDPKVREYVRHNWFIDTSKVRGDFMRDENRTRPFLEKLEELWKLYPDFRFGQLITLIKYTGTIEDIFYLEEDAWLEVIDKLIEYKDGDNNNEIIENETL